MKAHSTVLDPAGVREALLEGIAGIERDDSIELKGDAELKEFFDDIVKRGKKSSAGKKRKAAPGCLGFATDDLGVVLEGYPTDAKSESRFTALRAASRSEQLHIYPAVSFPNQAVLTLAAVDLSGE